MQKDMFNADN